MWSRRLQLPFINTQTSGILFRKSEEMLRVRWDPICPGGSWVSTGFFRINSLVVAGDFLSRFAFPTFRGILLRITYEFICFLLPSTNIATSQKNLVLYRIYPPHISGILSDIIPVLTAFAYRSYFFQTITSTLLFMFRICIRQPLFHFYDRKIKELYVSLYCSEFNPNFIIQLCNTTSQAGIAQTHLNCSYQYLLKLMC